MNAIFVYGTLRAGQRLFHLFDGKWTAIVKGTTQGKLISLKEFPALIKGEGKVVGEVIFIDDEYIKSTLSVLDHVEGVNKENPKIGLYRREKVFVKTSLGKIEAYAYIFNHPRASDERIECGDWVEFQNSRREKERVVTEWLLSAEEEKISE